MTTNCTDTDGGVPACYCPASGVVDLLARKHAIPLVCIVGAHEPVRFGDVENHLPTASTSTLSNRLGEFVESGLFARRQYDEIPPRVEYELTDDGRELRERLQPLVEWASSRE